jgi:ribosomal protein S18 acetylase RimI-like enzyme
MPKTDSAMLEQSLTLFTPEWWEQAPATTDACWAREEHAMEPERLRSRAYRADDQRAVVELLLSAQAAEPGFDWPGAGQLRALLADPALDLARNTCLWEDVHGKLIAFAVLRAGRYVLWFTRPSARGDGLDALIVAWATLRARAQAAAGATIALRTEARSIQTERLAALARLGFVAHTDGYSVRLTRSLAGADTPGAVGELPAGYRIRPLAPAELGDYLALARELFPRASRLPLSEGRRRALMDDPAYTPSLDLVVEAGDGALVGFCHSALRPDERERLGRRAGWIELLGVAPAHRRAGLARALLRAGLLALADYGADCALLTVRADNTSARALYAAEGFTPLFEERAYTLTLA